MKVEYMRITFFENFVYTHVISIAIIVLILSAAVGLMMAFHNWKKTGSFSWKVLLLTMGLLMVVSALALYHPYETATEYYRIVNLIG